MDQGPAATLEDQPPQLQDEDAVMEAGLGGAAGEELAEPDGSGGQEDAQDAGGVLPHAAAVLFPPDQQEFAEHSLHLHQQQQPLQEPLPASSAPPSGSHAHPQRKSRSAAMALLSYAAEEDDDDDDMYMQSDESDSPHGKKKHQSKGRVRGVAGNL